MRFLYKVRGAHRHQLIRQPEASCHRSKLSHGAYRSKLFECPAIEVLNANVLPAQDVPLPPTDESLGYCVRQRRKSAIAAVAAESSADAADESDRRGDEDSPAESVSPCTASHVTDYGSDVYELYGSTTDEDSG